MNDWLTSVWLTLLLRIWDSRKWIFPSLVLFLAALYLLLTRLEAIEELLQIFEPILTRSIAE